MKRQLTLGLFLILVISIFAIVSCEKDEGPIRIPPDLGPKYTVSFSKDVQPIFEKGPLQCTACHPPSGYFSLMPLEAYNDLVNIIAAGYAPAIRVIPGDTTNSVLWNKIRNVGGIFGIGMPPPPTGGLSDEDIETIGIWIMEGAVDN